MRRRQSNWWLPALAAAVLPLVGTAAAVADAPAPVAAPEPKAAPLTAEDASAWLDGFVPVALQRAGVAGAVVVVVKDGAVLVEKGYGTSDTATGAPVDPKRTLFRPGSVSKLFTWTAVMQLVEAGKLDLDADVNRYIDYKIPPRDGKPVTLRNIMTHTTGFEEAVRGLITTKPSGHSLGDEMKRWVPTRVFDPGTTPAYSNYGASLAGYIVERVSGEPFEKYIENHIYKPLGMDNSTFEQPLPARLEAQMSKGYADASKPAEPFEYVSMPPAGSMSGTGDDMAKFMIAHLEEGRLGDARILKPETAHLMHDTRTAIMAPLNGIELGFYDQDINGHRVIAHGGDTQFFHSNLLLFLNDHVGLYISMNSMGVPGASVRQMLFEQFADRYFPATPHDGRVDDKTAAEHLAMAAGHYVSMRGSFDNFLAVAGLFGQLKVIPNADGTLSIPMLMGPAGVPKKYREIAPFVWREVGGHDRVGAIVKDGRVVRVSSDVLSGIMVFDRAPASRSAGWLNPAAIAACAVLLLTLLAWPAAALIRRRYHAPFPFTGQRRSALRLARIGALAIALVLAGWLTLVSMMFGKGGMDRLMSLDGVILLLEALTLLATVGGSAAALYNVSAVWKGPSGWFGKLWSVLLAASCLVILWIAYAGCLMNFSAHY
ncbi:MAG: beta-lactamase family protein [Proteobacteria bacterium]|nr:beta-lactamase family protein [Pseudomonadota bacterium]